MTPLPMILFLLHGDNAFKDVLDVLESVCRKHIQNVSPADRLDNFKDMVAITCSQTW